MAPVAVNINGLTVTSIEQTVVDIACLNGGEAGLVVADFALHHELTSIEQIHELAERKGSDRESGMFGACWLSLMGASNLLLNRECDGASLRSGSTFHNLKS